MTGAGSGIGKAFALELGRRGGQVVCADIDKARSEATAAEITAGGERALAAGCDVADLDEVVARSERAGRWFDGAVDVVVNNAGVGIGGRPVGAERMEDWRWALGVNLWGVIHGCHVFAPQIRATGSGGIINVASAASFAAAPGMAAYSVSKAGVLALSETISAEMAGTGVQVTVLCPTFVKTNIARDGRIDASAASLADTMMRWTGWSAPRVARAALDAFDRGRLYALPQPDTRLVWDAKRHLPNSYSKGLGLVHRLTGSGMPAPDAVQPPGGRA
ncbi:SDR family NAD(P)-dependent oxidoreductase [Acidiferrimicrobium sp. IK]|nr:SDR family NAD(P)-dependent oxidoreductase [Acidiferrimicrobium sp. IK]MCU4187400.1 SDR family NAD(P)-dependent oxidoreductase [Acidiferrimicrobium sp. IK]